MRREQSSIVISGMGMVTSLSLDADSGCAAIRAGLALPSQLDRFKVFTPEEPGGQPVTVHAVPGTHGFEGQVRLQRLLSAAFLDLFSKNTGPDWATTNTGFYVSVADPNRTATCLALISDEESRSERAEIEPSTPQETADNVLNLLNTCLKRAKWPGASVQALRQLCISGHPGALEALGQAQNDLAAGVVDCAIVLGVDSLLDLETLQWLTETELLKTPETPVGLIPGEAAAVLVVESAQSVRARNGVALASIGGVFMGVDSDTLQEAKTPRGTVIAKLLQQALPVTGWSKPDDFWAICDHNGETYRATEWGNAMTHLLGTHPVFDAPNLFYPVVSIGDTGAAAGAVGLCLAVAAHQRAWARSPSVAVTCSGDGGNRAVAVVSKGYDA